MVFGSKFVPDYKEKLLFKRAAFGGTENGASASGRSVAPGVCHNATCGSHNQVLNSRVLLAWQK